MTHKYFERLMIEPTNICNLRCPICPTGAGFNKSPRGSMSFEQFRAVTEQAGSPLREIYLWGFGEPFLAPDIMKMLDYAGEKRIAVKIYTNGTALTEKIMDRFREKHRIDIRFSINGATQKSYAYNHGGGNLCKPVKNLSYLARLKKRRGLSSLRISWLFVVTKINEHEITAVHKMAERAGADALLLKTVGISKEHPRYSDFIPRNKSYRREVEGDDCRGSCFFVDPGIPCILWNGDTVPCCIDYKKEHVMGNVFWRSLTDIWYDRKYVEFRKNYAKGANVLCNAQCKFKRGFNIYVKP